ncbi:thioredoxin domain-containing protein [Desulfobacterales bacterium HSG2]|nr:thioredoxin domain-containing protein [Desulfobacterales bacterium HSG2]
MKKVVMMIAVFTGLFFFSGISGVIGGEITVKGNITIDEDELRKIIKKVIRENPKLILETINAYAKKEKREKQKKQLESSFKKRIKDIGVSDKNPSQGPKDAAITLVEYTDFECPYCSKGARTVKKVMEKYPEKVRVVFKNNPLDFHEQAMPAAKAALAANRQGKFWEYHDLLFENSSKLSEELLVKFAEQLKLDMKKFDDDRNSPEIADQIESEVAEAKKNKLRGTPTFVANGVVIRGAQKLNYFSKVIDRLLSEKKQK